MEGDGGAFDAATLLVELELRDLDDRSACKAFAQGG